MAKMLLAHNDVVLSKGPLAGVHLPYATKNGVTCGFLDDAALPSFDITAEPGMVVVDIRSDQLYVIDSSGDAHLCEQVALDGFRIDVSSHDFDHLAGYSRTIFDVGGMTAYQIGRRAFDAIVGQPSARDE